MKWKLVKVAEKVFENQDGCFQDLFAKILFENQDGCAEVLSVEVKVS